MGNLNSLKRFPTIVPDIEQRIIDLTNDDNVITFPTEDRKAAAPKDPNDPNWLHGMAKGTKFLVQSKMQHQDFTLGEFELVAKRDNSYAVLLHSDLNQETLAWVDSRRFCRLWGLFEVLQPGDE